jgi:ornithine cyclodeaminase
MGFDFEEATGEVHVKGAYLKGSPIFAVKVASGFYRNPDRGLPLSSGLVLVLDATTGFPLLLLHDNAYLTELRTAAAGALATRLLAPEKIEKMAMREPDLRPLQLRAIAASSIRARLRLGQARRTARDTRKNDGRSESGLRVSSAKALEDGPRRP